MTFAHPLLTRRPARSAPTILALPDAEELALMQGRVHESCGPAKRTFALWLAARMEGPVFWISPPWTQDRLNGDGVSDWINPARLVFVTPKRPEDLLWTMEEVLRSGAAPLCIADLPDLPNLTQVRRMHLAAEAGAKSGMPPSLGLLLTPGQGGAPGVETRWSLQPDHLDARDGWQLARVRARTAPYKNWHITRPTATATPTIKTL